MNRLIKELGMTPANDLITIDMVTRLNIDFCFWATGIRRCDLKEFRNLGARRRLSCKLLVSFNSRCLLNHFSDLYPVLL